MCFKCVEGQTELHGPQRRRSPPRHGRPLQPKGRACASVSLIFRLNTRWRCATPAGSRAGYLYEVFFMVCPALTEEANEIIIETWIFSSVSENLITFRKIWQTFLQTSITFQISENYCHEIQIAWRTFQTLKYSSVPCSLLLNPFFQPKSWFQRVFTCTNRRRYNWERTSKRLETIH